MKVTELPGCQVAEGGLLSCSVAELLASLCNRATQQLSNQVHRQPGNPVTRQPEGRLDV
jgi:hypothetical protein